MTKLSCVVFAIAVAGCASEDQSPEEATEEQGITVNAGVLFSDGNWFGTSFAVPSGPFGTWSCGNLPPSFDNIASSLTMRPNCGIELFLDPDQGNQVLTIYHSDLNLLPIGVDNAASSFCGYCTPHCAAGKHYCGPDVGCTAQLCE